MTLYEFYSRRRKRAYLIGIVLDKGLKVSGLTDNGVVTILSNDLTFILIVMKTEPTQSTVVEKIVGDVKR